MVTAITLKIVNNIFEAEFAKNSFSVVVGWFVFLMLMCSLIIDICLAKIALSVAF